MILATLALLDVGQGMCGVLYDEVRTIVIDCPPGNVLPEFLRVVVRRNHIDDLLITHGDSDHCGGVDRLLKDNGEFTIGRLWINAEPWRVREATKSQEARSLGYATICGSMKELYGVGRPQPRSELSPESFMAERVGGCSVTCLAPLSHDVLASTQANPRSAVLHVRDNDGGVGVATFMGDITFTALAALGLEPDQLKSKWLVYPHHGGATSPSDSGEPLGALLQRLVAPNGVFMSFARHRDDLPRDEAIEGLRSAGQACEIVCSQLSQRCEEQPVSMRGEHLFQIGRGYQLTESHWACGGTVLVSAETGWTWQGADHHRRHVSQFQSPRCVQVGESRRAPD